jgi:hypothetical protein
MKKAPSNPPAYPTMPIGLISFGTFLVGNTCCPNCDEVIKYGNSDLPYCIKCHYIFGEVNPRKAVDDLNTCPTCGYKSTRNTR